MSVDLLRNDEEFFYKQLFKEFHKTKQDLEEYIEIMRKWADAQLHFPEKPSYPVLRSLILYNKFSIEKTKERLDMYYSMRNLMPEYFCTTPFSSDMVLQCKAWRMIPLPKSTDDNSRIIYQQLNPEYDDPKFFIHDKLISQFVHLMQYLMERDLCYRFHYICDCTGLKLGHGLNTSPMALKKGSLIVEKVFSNRLASIYLTNFPSFLEQFVNTVLKPFLSPKLRDRLHINSSSEVLFEVFDKEILPKDIGGGEKSVEELNDLLMEKYEEHKERFLELETLKVDESLRPATLNNDELLGYYGHFKKLNVD